MAEEKRIKHYKVKQKGTMINFHTDLSLNGSIKSLLLAIFNHVWKTKPDLIKEYVEYVNEMYELSMNKHSVDDPDHEDGWFFRRLMEQGPGES